MTSARTIAELLRDATQILERTAVRSARLDAEVLLGAAAGVDRSWIIAHERDEAAAHETRRWLGTFDAWVQRRAAHEPVAYILGQREFWSLEFEVTPAVLVPRPETELLVERVLTHAPRRIVDLGTGSGCIAVALATELGGAMLTATDVSPQALAVARRNVLRHGVQDRVRFVCGDLFEPLEGERFDAVVSNPPYVPEGAELEADVRDFEPATALYGGHDGLAVIRRLVEGAPAHLSPDGTLCIETGVETTAETLALLRARGFAEVRVHHDLAGIPRVVEARACRLGS